MWRVNGFRKCGLNNDNGFVMGAINSMRLLL